MLLSPVTLRYAAWLPFTDNYFTFSGFPITVKFGILGINKTSQLLPVGGLLMMDDQQHNQAKKSRSRNVAGHSMAVGYFLFSFWLRCFGVSLVP